MMVHSQDQPDHFGTRTYRMVELLCFLFGGTSPSRSDVGHSLTNSAASADVTLTGEDTKNKGFNFLLC